MSNKLFGAIFAGAAVALVSVFLFVAFQRTPVHLSGALIPSVFALPYPAEANYRQTGNNCGPYSAAAVVRALEGKDVISSEQVVAQMPLRVPGYFTMPQGIRMFLGWQGYAAQIDDASGLDEESRLQFLRERLAVGDALILLVGRSLMTQHYLTVVGYDRLRDVFFVYNSALAAGENDKTVDQNGAEAGNVTMSSRDLLNYWAGGGVLGFYRWTALTARPE